MSKWVFPAPRLFLIALLVLLTSIFVEIQTYATEKPDYVNGRNKNARIISTRTTTRVSATNRTSGKREITTPLISDAKGTIEARESDRDVMVKQSAIDNVNPDVQTGEMTSKKPSTKGTTQSNIFSIPTRRPKKSRVMRPSTPAPQTKPPTAAANVTSETAAAHDQGDNEELSMIDLEDHFDIKREQKYNNNVGKIYKNEQLMNDRNTREMITKNSEGDNILLSTENYPLNSNSDKKNSNSAQSVSSHIYKVNLNYKRYKKLNIVPSKPLWRDPNDNSWRNESISSLGIKFTPKINATKVFQLKKKELSELETPMPETENSTNLGLRERLDKLSEIRKSKKKLNATSSMESTEDGFDYEQETSDYASSRNPSIATYVLPPSLPTLPPSTPLPTSSSPPPPLPPRRSQVKSTTHLPINTQILEDKKQKHRYFNDQNLAKSDDQSNIQMIPLNIAGYLDKIKYSETKDESITKNTTSKDYEKEIANSNYYQTQHKTIKIKQRYTTTANPKANQYDYNAESDIHDNYEYEDYEFKLSSDVINSSQTWSEKKAWTEVTQSSQTTETSLINNFTNILDSLTQYLTTDKYSTTATYVQRDNEELDKSRMSQFKNDDFMKTKAAGMGLNFTDNINLPIGPRNKDRINLPQSYSYNTIPHNKMLVRYNTTIIHRTTQENSNIYNTHSATEPMHIQAEQGGHISNWEHIPPRISNMPSTHPEPYSNSVTTPQYIVGDDIFNKDEILRISFPGILLQNPTKNDPAVQNVVNIVTIPANVNPYEPPHEIVPKLGSIPHDAPENTMISRQHEKVYNYGAIIKSSTIKEPMFDFVNHDKLIEHNLNDRSHVLTNTEPKRIMNIGTSLGRTRFSPLPPNSQLPMLYNSTVHHGSMRTEQDFALSSVYMKGGYKQSVGATGQHSTHHLHPDYHLHFYAPRQNTHRQVPFAQNIP